jgi:hypothetical protein
MTNARVPESVAGLVFDSSTESDNDLAIGAVFVGKRERDLVISTKETVDRYDIIYEGREEVSGDAADVIEIERIGTRYRFIVNDRQVATWNEPATMRGALKLYVWDGHVVVRDWAIETLGTR